MAKSAIAIRARCSVSLQGIARLAIDERERPCPVVFCSADAYMLGASTLEIFNLSADWVNGWLLPEECLSLGRAGEQRHG